VSGRFSVDGMRLGLVAAVALVVLLAVASPVQAKELLAKSTFDEGSEGWKVVGDVRGSSEKPNHHKNGGANKDGGYISIEDDVLGGTMYWRAPKEFLSKMASAYGGRFYFSLRQHSAMERPYDADDMILEGGGVTLVYDHGFIPDGSWTSYEAAFTEEGWINKATGAPATAEELDAVLRSLSVFAIRAEYEAGEDVDDLDDVAVTGTGDDDAAFCRKQKLKLQEQTQKIDKLTRLLREVDDQETKTRLRKKRREVKRERRTTRDVIKELC